ECIQTGFLNLTQQESDLLCAYMEGVGIRGGAMKRPFTYIKGGDEQALAQLNTSRERICAPLRAFASQIAAAKTADDTVRAVMALLEDVQAFDTLSDMRQALESAGLPSEAEDCAQVWNRLMETLDQLHTLLGEKSAPPSLVLQLLGSGLAALELAALPPADGAVVCGEIGNVRTARIDTLFALGMNDTASACGAGLFTPQEQEEAAQITGAYLGMSQTERAALAQLDELKTLSAAKKQLIISYALADETGRALREGMAVQNLRRLFVHLPVRGGILAAEREDMLCAPDAALEALAVQLSCAADSGEGLSRTYRQTYAALNRTGDGEEKLHRITQVLGSRPKAQLSAAQARALYGRPVMSVSRLETFAQCPYRHFVSYGLSPQEKQEPGVDRAELGTLYHEAAERFTCAITALDGFPQVDEQTCDAVMGDVLAPLIEQWRQSPLGASRRGEAIARRIEKTARRAGRSIAGQFAGGRFKPLSFEMVFGKKGAAPIMLELGDGSYVYLQGRIDRIDVLDEGTKRIRVVDYKSGTKQFDPTMVYFGIQLQLLLYLAAALNEFPGAQPAGFFYCRIADPTIRSESRVKEEIEKQIAKKLSLA
ncbi:MAG: PD-(D/E)XK nuclease family protein, partial [Eubacteriales bacterium]|nr:PD-(D/E)XK nuclease family protein [Eubacteriales bacterium]